MEMRECCGVRVGVEWRERRFFRPLKRRFRRLFKQIFEAVRELVSRQFHALPASVPSSSSNLVEPSMSEKTSVTCPEG